MDTSSTNNNTHSNIASSSNIEDTDIPTDQRLDLPFITDDYWPLIDGNPEDDYDFGPSLEEGKYVTLASGISIPQFLAPVSPKDTSQQLSVSLYAKSYLIDREFEMQAVMLHIRTWYGIDKIDRPGCGKIVKGYIYGQSVTIESNSSSSSFSTSLDSTTEVTRELPRITIIFEGSPNPQIELRTGFDECYTYFSNNIVGRGGNAGLIGTNSPQTRGGVFLGMATDFSKPLPTIAVKRVDGRDILLLPENSRPAKHINNDKGIHRLNEEINTWASVHYPSPHPRVVRIFDAFLDKTDIPGCNVASIVMECAPPGTIANPEATPQAIERAKALAARENRRPPPIPQSTLPRPSDLVDFVITTRHPLHPVQAVHVMSQVLMTLFHMHNRFPQIIHRDIKGDNIILWDILQNVPIWTIDETTKKEVNAHPGIDLYLVKLADFGEARFLDPDNEAFTNVGTDAYKAPEVVRKKAQTPAVDVYSCGVTLYTLLLAAAPFGTDHGNMQKSEWLKKLQQGAHAFQDSPYLEKFKKVSEHAQSAIIQMMHPEPEKRITIPELFHHSLFRSFRKFYYKAGNRRVPLVPDFHI